MQLSALYIYPVKSLAGIALQEADVALRGLRYDRRWMLTDTQGQFVTQREIPEMALIGTAIEGRELVLFNRRKEGDQIRVPLNMQEVVTPKLRAQVWSSRVTVYSAGNEADAWLSDRLGHPLRLVALPEQSRRPADGRYAPKGQYVSLADGFPFLLIGQASLDDLNQRLTDPVPMDRFRPNLVVTGSAAFAEDGWRDLRIGNQLFRCVKPCARCMMTTIDQQTIQKSAEPLRTLSGYRRNGNKVLFGQNVIWLGSGTDAVVRVGDSVIPVSE